MNDDLPTTYNPINRFDISTPSGFLEYQRNLDDVTGQYDHADDEASFLPFIKAVALLAVFGFIFSYIF